MDLFHASECALTVQAAATEDQLILALDKELAKIIKFVMAKEAETLGKLEQLDLATAAS